MYSKRRQTQTHLKKLETYIITQYGLKKIASLCIANRLKVMLPKIIHEDQEGFMKGRYIGKNIRLLYDVLQYAETNKLPGLRFLLYLLLVLNQ